MEALDFKLRSKCDSDVDSGYDDQGVLNIPVVKTVVRNDPSGRKISTTSTDWLAVKKNDGDNGRVFYGIEHGGPPSARVTPAREVQITKDGIKQAKQTDGDSLKNANAKARKAFFNDNVLNNVSIKHFQKERKNEMETNQAFHLLKRSNESRGRLIPIIRDVSVTKSVYYNEASTQRTPHRRIRSKSADTRRKPCNHSLFSPTYSKVLDHEEMELRRKWAQRYKKGAILDQEYYKLPYQIINWEIANRRSNSETGLNFIRFPAKKKVSFSDDTEEISASDCDSDVSQNDVFMERVNRLPSFATNLDSYYGNHSYHDYYDDNENQSYLHVNNISEYLEMCENTPDHEFGFKVLEKIHDAKFPCTSSKNDDNVVSNVFEETASEISQAEAKPEKNIHHSQKANDNAVILEINNNELDNSHILNDPNFNSNARPPLPASRLSNTNVDNINAKTTNQKKSTYKSKERKKNKHRLTKLQLNELNESLINADRNRNKTKTDHHENDVYERIKEVIHSTNNNHNLNEQKTESKKTSQELDYRDNIVNIFMKRHEDFTKHQIYLRTKTNSSQPNISVTRFSVPFSAIRDQWDFVNNAPLALPTDKRPTEMIVETSQKCDPSRYTLSPNDNLKFDIEGTPFSDYGSSPTASPTHSTASPTPSCESNGWPVDTPLNGKLAGSTSSGVYSASCSPSPNNTYCREISMPTDL